MLDDATLVAFVDGELDPSTMHDVAAQIAGDSAAKEKERLLRTSVSLVRAAFADPCYQVVPATLAERVLRPTPPRLGRRRVLAMATAASVATLMVGFAGGTMWREVLTPPPPGDSLLADIAEYHVAYAEEGSGFGAVPAAHTAEIKTWLHKLLQHPVQIPDLERFGLTFHAARLLIAGDRPVAQLLYVRAGQPRRPLGLCVTAGTPQRPALSIVHRNGVVLAQWGTQGVTYVLVGWEAPDMLARLARHLQSTPTAF